MGAEIHISGLSVSFGTQKVIDGLNLSVPAGSILSIVGLSGCGKTTLLKTISGQLDPSVANESGTVTIDGIEPCVAVTKLEVAMCFQRPFLFPWLTTRDNIALHRRLHPGVAAKESLDEILDSFGLSAAAAKYPSELSGGMAQRTALAREFARQPDVLLLDEPFANLDCVTREQLNDHLLRFARQLGTTVVIVTHDPEEAVYVADRVAVLHRGRFSDPPRDSGANLERTSQLRQTTEFRNTVEWVINSLKNSESALR